jgi:predicted MFS family arabinose efflux permease
MAAFKAFVQWLPPEQIPFANGIQMVSGGFGALVATVPVEWALVMTDWRGLFLGVAALTLAAAAAVFLIVPEKEVCRSGESFAEQLLGLRQVLVSRDFWRITPWAVAGQASYLSLVSLWAGPWLRDVAGYPRPAVANTLMLVALAMMAGYFAFGALAARLNRRGVPTVRVAASGMLLFLGTQVWLALQNQAMASVSWVAFGFFGTACILPYAVLSRQFPPHLSGRVNTSLNLLVFLGAFAAQWGVGVIVGRWPGTANEGYAPDGYGWGILLLAGVQLLGAGWYAFSAAVARLTRGGD